MPPQQTNVTPEIGRIAAGLGLPIALAKDARIEALAAQRLNASPATRGDALSENDAAGPTTASTQRVLGLLKRFWRAFQARRQRQRLGTTLSDRQLIDIGLTRDEIDYITPERAIETLRDRATALWSRGVM